jgi:hypothetical protein
VPSKHLARWFIVGGVVVVAIVVAVMVKIGSEPRVIGPKDLDLVSIQVRSFPAYMPVAMDGHPRGKTPIMLEVPRSDVPRAITVKIHGHEQTKTVVPQDDMVVDFKQ